MQISIRHTTRTHRPDAPAHGLQRLRLKPKSGEGQVVHAWDMTVEGATIQVQYDDHNENPTALVSFAPDTRAIVVHCAGLVETADNAGIIAAHEGSVPLWVFAGHSELTRPGPRLRALAERFCGADANRLDQLHGLAAAVRDMVALAPGHTDAGTAAEAALAGGRGACRDHAQIFIAAARLLDIPARYVNGYRLTDELADAPAEQQAAHGWAEAYIDTIGWVGFDVVHGTCPDGRYVRVATGCDYRDAAPVTGIGPGKDAVGSDTAVLLAVERQPPHAGAHRFQTQ